MEGVPTGHQDEQKSQQVTLKRIAAIVAVFTVVVAIASLSFFFFNQNRMEETTDAFEDLTGRIFLTLAPEGTKEADIYYYDFSDGELHRFVDDEFTKYTPRFSPSGNKVAYAGAVLDREAPLRESRQDRDSFPFRGALRLHVRDMQTGEVTQLTDGDVSVEHFAGIRVPRWSPDGTRIAFSAQQLAGGQYALQSPLEPDSWDIFITDLEGNVEHIGEGLYSLWSPDGSKLLTLRNDGLHIYHLESKQSFSVYPVTGGSAAAGMKLDLSRDKTFLAWGDSPGRKFHLFKIESWEPLFIRPVRTVNTGNTLVIWPVFSPDNKYVAAQMVEVEGRYPEDLTNMRLAVYELENFEQVDLVSLEDFNFNVSYITDWMNQ